MRRVPEFRLVIQTDKGWQCRAGAEDAEPGELLIQGPEKLVHVNVRVVRRRRCGEGSAGNRALLVDHGSEACHIRWIGHAHGAALVGGDQTLQLDGHYTRHPKALIRSDKAAYPLAWRATGA